MALADETISNKYDSRGRLVQVVSTGTAHSSQTKTRSYCFDKAGNRLVYDATTGTPPTCVKTGYP